ncbi:MAG: hypothetical protein B6245_23760 [Desulfobacteraceae bacterium 4572_88]|nr:MAG: hypothetical protein B6245_23760 [Desulfobacteraceae bacterium 4572_88]
MPHFYSKLLSLKYQDKTGDNLDRLSPVAEYPPDISTRSCKISGERDRTRKMKNFVEMLQVFRD